MAKQSKSKDANKGGIINFFKGIFVEIKEKITWPSTQETKKATIAVFLFTLAYAVIIGVFDYAFQNLFELILKLK